MRLLKLRGKNDTPVYIAAQALSVVDIPKHDEFSIVYTLGGNSFGVYDTPEQIFELIHAATGEPVVWHSAKEDADAVDTAIDEAYKRGFEDAFKSERYTNSLVEAENRGFSEAFKSERFQEGLAEAEEHGFAEAFRSARYKSGLSAEFNRGVEVGSSRTADRIIEMVSEKVRS